MATTTQIRNPLEWGVDQFKQAQQAMQATGRALGGEDAARGAPLAIRRIGPADLVEALRLGMADFAACRSDVVFLGLAYAVAGLLLVHVTFGQDLLPLVFPLASGFALLGPVAAVGLYEMSRRRERGEPAGWAEAFAVLRSPAFGAILVLGLYLLAIFLTWMVAAFGIYHATLGPEPPVSVAAFARDVATTPAGWTMTVAGIAVGFVFAVLALAISVISFPMLLDRDVGLYPAIGASIRAVVANPGTMAAWGLIVAAGLVLGSIPMFLGLAFVLPVLGHATWHLYRRLVPRLP